MGYSMDMSQEKPVSRKRLLPEGWRQLDITNVIPEVSKSGNDMFIFTMKDVETGYEDRVYAISTQGKRWMLKLILSACGVNAGNDGVYNWDFPEVMNKRIEGLFEHEDNEFINRNGETVKTKQHKIVDFRAVNVNPDGVALPNDIQWPE